jgi:hypothetical protein
MLPISYSEVMTLVLGIFALVGFSRGWYREAITSLFVGALALLVWRPEVMELIIEQVNALLRFVIQLFLSGFNPAQFSAQQVSPGWLLNSDSYRLYIVITVILVVVSYVIGERTFQGRVTALGRILGGLLGLANGYILSSLVRQYLERQAKAMPQAQAAPPGGFTIQFTDVPAENFFAGYGILFVFVILIGVIALLVAGDRVRLPLK